MSASTSVASSAEGEATVARSRGGRRPWTAAAGLGYVVLSSAGLALAPLPDLGAPIATVRAFLGSARPPSYVSGGCAALLAYVALICFVVGVTLPLRRSGDRRGAAALTVAGATLAAGAIATAAALVGGVVLTRAVAVPTAQVLLTAGSVATWLSVIGIALALAGITASGPDGTGLPRWILWTAAVLAAVLTAAVPLAASPLAHVPALLLDLWVLVVAVLLLRRAPAHR